MNEPQIVQHAQELLAERDRYIRQLEASLEAARSLTTTLEEEAHACTNTAHHRGWWETHEAEL